VLNEIRDNLLRLRAEMLPKSPSGKAVAYTGLYRQRPQTVTDVLDDAIGSIDALAFAGNEPALKRAREAERTRSTPVLTTKCSS
jgi:hypothetical protein